jgi:hypothetical protein
MCYSVESSLRTTLLSFFSIVYLLSSGIPHFQWIGVTLIGWCGMQFDELLLWLTNPRKGCTTWNNIITMSLIPFTLFSQPIFALWGALYVFPWKKLTNLNKQLMIFYTIMCMTLMYFIHFFNPSKVCTTVTEQGHLNWTTSKFVGQYKLFPYIWLIIIVLPLLIIWKKSFLLILLICIIPIFGFFYGSLKTDSHGSIWCYYTSYTSIIAVIALFLQQNNIYHIL